MKVTVKDRQNLLDVAIQVLGSAEGVFALAVRNGISITDRLEDGQELEYDLGDIFDTHTADLIAARKICPATEIPKTDEKELLRRVGTNYNRIISPLYRPEVVPLYGTTYDSGVTEQLRRHLEAEKVEPPAEVNVLDSTLNAAIQAAQKNEAPPSESGQAVTSIFNNQFNDTFA
ncbi:MAG: hypothetical protein NC301_07705 [Bacteroides sp.]|nr:hypothetical protein [Bacteroides sp.]MCM1380033.1 hypothetical protein [Bacteroides sp.]MCM1446372.1 hypothetical protein [Prevotella sp.]